MVDQNKKWLTEQLLDIFEKQQIKELQPTAGKTSPRFTAAIKMLLLAIAKYENCFMSVKTIGTIATLAERHVLENLKILEQNKIITIERRFKKSGSKDTSLYSINMETVVLFFGYTSLPLVSTLLTKGKYPSLPKVSTLLTKGKIIKLINNQSRLNKEREREENPLSDSFVINEENKALAIEKGLLWENVHAKFVAHYLSTSEKRTNWHAAEKKWILDERKKEKKEIRSTVKDFQQSPPAKLADTKTVEKNMALIKQTLGIKKNKLEEKTMEVKN